MISSITINDNCVDNCVDLWTKVKDISLATEDKRTVKSGTEKHINFAQRLLQLFLLRCKIDCTSKQRAQGSNNNFHTDITYQ